MEKAIVILKTDKESFLVNEDSRGKMLIYTTDAEQGTMDAFKVGIGWDSLAQLRDKSHKTVFSWKIKDNSFEVHGNRNQWRLQFHSNQTGISANLWLSEDETKMLKNALFRD